MSEDMTVEIQKLVSRLCRAGSHPSQESRGCNQAVLCLQALA